MKTDYIIGQISTPAGEIDKISTVWSRSDIISTIKVRWSIGRMNYSVTPGLYAVGAPDSDSDVFVSCNFKLSFDHVRRALHGLNAWILFFVFAWGTEVLTVHPTSIGAVILQAILRIFY